jgi:aspartate/methionine/tyrosine aminotransferase
MHLPPFQLERYFARYEFTAPYLLCCSDCEAMTLGDLLALEPDAADRFQRVWLGYTESQGSASLRREICRGYAGLAPDQVLVHSGAEEAIFGFMHALLNPGDHVVVHWPCYQSLVELPQSLGCEVTLWTAEERNGWALSLDALAQSLRPTTRAIILNTPHNPTGFLMPERDLREVVRLARASGATLFSDEVYRGLEYREADCLPAACDLDPGAVSLGVLSKAYGLPGLRIGWVATRDQDLLARMAAVKDYTTICNSAPSEFLAELALRHGRPLIARNREIIAANLAVLEECFAGHRDLIAWQRPHAGPIAFPRLLAGDVNTFCQDLVRQAGVLLLPGSVYGDHGNHFRVGFGRQNLPEAVARLEQYLRTSPPQTADHR